MKNPPSASVRPPTQTTQRVPIRSSKPGPDGDAAAGTSGIRGGASGGVGGAASVVVSVLLSLAAGAAPGALPARGAVAVLAVPRPALTRRSVTPESVTPGSVSPRSPSDSAGYVARPFD